MSLKKPILIEETVKELISLYVAEPDVVASVKKKTREKDLVFSEGSYKNFKANIEVEQLAMDSAKAVESQIVRIDMALSPEPMVVNINLNPDIIVPSKATGINVAEKMIKSVHENLNHYLEKPKLFKFFDDAKSIIKDVFKSKQLI